MPYGRKSGTGGYNPPNKTVLERLGISASNNLTIDGVERIPAGGGGTDATFMKYSGKKMYCFGDSTTNSGNPVNVNNYPTHLAAKLGATITNYGSSGADHNRFRCIVCGGTSNGGLTFTAPNYTGVDVVTLTIGHNSGPGASTISDISGSDFNLYPDTFYGNFGRCIEYIYNQNRNIRVYLLTPIQSTNGTNGPNSNSATPAIKALGEKYALPVVDLHNISGLNFRSLAFYTTDGTHPNEEGAQKIADVLYRQMLSY